MMCDQYKYFETLAVKYCLEISKQIFLSVTTIVKQTKRNLREHWINKQYWLKSLAETWNTFIFL